MSGDDARRHLVRRLGTERPRRPGDRRLQPLGRPGAPDALAGRIGRLGAVRARGGRRAPDTNTTSAVRTAAGTARPTRWPRSPSSRPRPRPVVYEPGYEWGDRRVAGRSGPGATRWPAPMSVYEVHIGSWRPGLSYTELADQLTDYVTELGFTPRRVPAGRRAPVRRILGLPGDLVLRADGPVRLAGRVPAPGRPPASGWHRRHPRLGAGALPPRRAGRWRRFDGTPLYEHPDPRRGEHPDWGTLIFDYGRPEVRNFLVANAIYWLEEFHADGLRVDAVASMLYLDYSRKPRASGRPTRSAAGRTWTRSRSCARSNATCYKRVPGITMIAEESTAWPGVTTPGAPRRARVRPEVEHRLDARHADLPVAGPGLPHYHQNEITFSMVYAFSENFVLPLSHDEVVHGKGSLLRKMPGDGWQQFAGLRGAAGLPVGPPGQAAAVHGIGIRPGQRVVRADRARLAGAAGRQRMPQRSAAAGQGPEPGVRRQPGAVAAGIQPGRVQLDRRERRRRERARILRFAEPDETGLGRRPSPAW